MLPAYYYVLLLGGIATLDLQVYTAIEVRGRFPAPKYGYFRLMRTVTVTVTVITAETMIIRVIIVPPFHPEGISPACTYRPGISSGTPCGPTR
jgi:hypothetical protein